MRKKLKTLKKDKYDIYRTLVSMLDFYETIGYFSKVQYILPRDAIELYGPSIKDYDKVFREHILERQKTEEDQWIFDNFLWLANEIKKRYN